MTESEFGHDIKNGIGCHEIMNETSCQKNCYYSAHVLRCYTMKWDIKCDDEGSKQTNKDRKKERITVPM
jgi:hypothetical protein